MWLRANGATVEKPFLSNGIPEMEMSLTGTLTIGRNVELQNGLHYNMIGRQQKCYFTIGKNT
jgi:hypothetical protein